MDKKLFEEEELLRQLPKEVIELIDTISSVPTDAVREIIMNSEEMGEFQRSITLPELEKVEKKSMLVEDVKLRVKNGQKKKVK